MTVCIAAVCGFGDPDGPYIVAAADRMITIGQLQYEPAQTKTVHFAAQTIGLFAGDMQLHASVVPSTFEKAKEIDKERGRITVEEIANTYAEEFGFYRRSMAEREVLFPLNMTFDSFSRKQQLMAHYQVSEITDRLTSFAIDSSAIIAGIDHTGAHLFVIQNPGVAVCYDTPFFVSIGSGEALASTQFIVSKYDKTWPFPEALWLTFSAKARAEVAGGVGRQSDVVVIGRGGRVHSLTDEQKDVLYDLFETLRKEESEATKRAVNNIEEYIKSLSDTEADNPASGEQLSAKNGTQKTSKKTDKDAKGGQSSEQEQSS